MSTSIITLLVAQKLNDENYKQWKSNINTILMIDDLRFVLQEDCPQAPAPNATVAVRNIYDRWIKANDKAKVDILASISDVLAKKHENSVITKEIMDSLQSMFGQPSSQARHEALNSIYNSRMKKDSSVREHVLNLMVHFNVAESNMTVIDEQSQVCFILESLPKTFLPFCSNAEIDSLRQFDAREMTLKVRIGEVVSVVAVTFS
ncbi:uncharacterized protein LOC111024637 [Momordica charantia]|uniref:Uncharacterized protein LOC111024637 n=1 Tax=Momordica charantia TaxID=3673 RepID=A0A6J1DW68_MOMCH|nr:uncharacterized protein LOC111024637 [Momordica charantia]